MSAAQIAIGVAGTLIEIAVLLGLFKRRHDRREPVLVLYVAAVLVTNTAVAIWYRWDVWLVHQAVTAAARFGLALGVAYGVFRNFPSALATARRVLLFVLAVTLVGVLSIAGGEPTYTDMAGILIPRIANGTAWLFTAVAALVLWYRLPLTGLQKAILLGMTPYLLVFTVAMNLLASVGWHVRNQVGYADTLAFTAMFTYWCIAVWRPVGVAEVHQAAADRVVVGTTVGSPVRGTP